jgi:hypothetical protein
LRDAKVGCIAFVMLFVQKKAADGEEQMRERLRAIAGGRQRRTGDESDPRRGRGFWVRGGPVERGQLGERAVPVVESRGAARVSVEPLAALDGQGQGDQGQEKEVASGPERSGCGAPI